MKINWSSPLHEELADATTIVWKLQHALSESQGSLTPEIVKLAGSLVYRANVIEGQVSRWEVAEKAAEWGEKFEAMGRQEE